MFFSIALIVFKFSCSYFYEAQYFKSVPEENKIRANCKWITEFFSVPGPHVGHLLSDKGP